MRKAFNLTSLQTDLKIHSEYKELSKKISRYLSVRSFRRDIQSAKTSIDALTVMQDADGHNRYVFGQALMVHAIIMYCRAAIEDGNGRFKIGVTKEFTKAQIARHQDIVKLRNKSLAHFDIGEGAYGVNWIQEFVILKAIDGVATVSDVWSRSNFIARLAFDLNDVCETALNTLDKEAGDRQADLSSELFRILAFDKRLMSLIEAHEFDPSKFFAGGEGAEIFWSGVGGSHEYYTPKITCEEFSETVGPTVATRLGEH
jgi:hypothetical protein